MKKIKSPFNTSFCSLTVKPWRVNTCYCNRLDTFQKHTIISPWNVKVKCRKRVPEELGYLFSTSCPFPLTRESWRVPDFLTHILGAGCCALCNCNSIKANRAAFRLSASLTMRKKGRARKREGERLPVSRRFSHNVYIQGNNTFYTARLLQGGVTKIQHPVV